MKHAMESKEKPAHVPGGPVGRPKSNPGGPVGMLKSNPGGPLGMLKSNPRLKSNKPPRHVPTGKARGRPKKVENQGSDHGEQ